MTGPEERARAEQMAQELLGPFMAGSMKETVNKGVRIGVAFSVECIERAVADYADRRETAIAEALTATATAVKNTAEQLFQPINEQER